MLSLAAMKNEEFDFFEELRCLSSPPRAGPLLDSPRPGAYPFGALAGTNVQIRCPANLWLGRPKKRQKVRLLGI